MPSQLQTPPTATTTPLPSERLSSIAMVFRAIITCPSSLFSFTSRPSPFLFPLSPPSFLSFLFPSLPRNAPKNRPGAPLPPSSSRVKLQLVFEEVGSDYINAKYVWVFSLPLTPSFPFLPHSLSYPPPSLPPSLLSYPPPSSLPPCVVSLVLPTLPRPTLPLNCRWRTLSLTSGGKLLVY